MGWGGLSLGPCWESGEGGAGCSGTENALEGIPPGTGGPDGHLTMCL